MSNAAIHYNEEGSSLPALLRETEFIIDVVHSAGLLDSYAQA